MIKFSRIALLLMSNFFKCSSTHKEFEISQSIFRLEKGCLNFCNDSEISAVLEPSSILNVFSIGLTELQSLPSIQVNSLMHLLFPKLSSTIQNCFPSVVLILDANSILQSLFR